MGTLTTTKEKEKERTEREEEEKRHRGSRTCNGTKGREGGSAMVCVGWGGGGCLCLRSPEVRSIGLGLKVI